MNLAASGTRKEHLLLDERTLQAATLLRRKLMGMQPRQQAEQLLAVLNALPTNEEVVARLLGHGTR